MFRNHLLLALRNLRRNKLHAAINVAGLAIGISACVVIFLIVDFQLGFDTFRRDRDRIYRIYSSFSGAFSGTNRGVPAPLGPTLREEGSGFDALTAFFTWSAEAGPGGGQNKELGRQKEIVFADPEFFEVFPDAEWIAGTPAAALGAPHQVALTEKKARLYFGLEEPSEAMGRTVVYEDSLAVTVAGIIKDPPAQTDLVFQDYISYATVKQSWVKDRFGIDEWTSTNSNSQVFVRLPDAAGPESLNGQLAEMKNRYVKENADASWKSAYHLQPFTDLHFNTELGIFDNSRTAAHRPTLYVLMLIAGLLLLIAAINFINLETAQAARRAREVGVRKVLGSTRGELIRQFLSETALTTFFAVLLSVVLAEGSLRLFKEFIPEEMELKLADPGLLAFLAATVVVVTLLAGAYPAFVLSSFRPIQTLKDQVVNLRGATRAVNLRKSLIVFQFAVAQVLIFGTFVIGRQINYMLDKDLGFDKDAIIFFSTPWTDNTDRRYVLEQELRRLPEVAAMSLHERPPAESGYSTSVMKYDNGKETLDLNVHRKFGDTAFIRLYDMELLAGRNLLPGDSVREFIINETLAARMGFDSPLDALGKTLHFSDRDIPVVGVVRDFHIQSLHNPIEPVAIGNNRRDFRGFSLKLRTEGKSLGDFSAVAAKVEEQWKKLYPEEPFEYKFIEESVAAMYEAEQRTARLARTATGIAILISCLGLFGLISFMAVQRTKEIGIRKVLGATVGNIVGLLSSDFLRLVLVASAIGLPLAGYLAQRWLADFAFRIRVEWWMFAVVALTAAAVALLTVGLRAWRAARANPADSLKYE